MKPYTFVNISTGDPVANFYADQEADAVANCPDGCFVSDEALIVSMPTIDPADEAREIRNNRLASSDWTQVADAPVDQAAWATYRQALRDITAQAGFPESIDWPVQPV